MEDILKEFLKYKEIEEEEFIEYTKLMYKDLKPKKFGLIWEDKVENVHLELLKKFPLLEEIKEKSINTKLDDTVNILIEGDNLYSLKTLQYTHRNKVDLILIDPPYNRGKKDFRYNDIFVNSEDVWKHSKWLSFMNKRLRLSQEILSDDGIIIISIDDNELCNLKLLCDGIFGPENFVAILPTIMNLKGNQGEYGFAGTHEYNIVYVKDKTKSKFGLFDVDDEEVLNSWEEDNIGLFKRGASLIASGQDSKREKREKMYYPILINNDNEISTITEDEYRNIYNRETKIFDDNFVEELRKKYEDLGFTFLLPLSARGEKLRWRWGWNESTLLKLKTDLMISYNKGKIVLYKKQRPSIDDLPGKKPKSLFYKPEYSSGNATDMIKEMFNGHKVFENPKPVELIKDLIKIASKKDSIILDFFAGSGTTGQAVLQLNKEDGGSRRFILCTNNENNICEEVTYKRLEKVINGYTTNKGKKIEAIKGNLKYYKTLLTDIEQDIDDNVEQLVAMCTDVISIKEDCFNIEEQNNDYDIITSNDKIVLICKNPLIMKYELDYLVKSTIGRKRKKKVIYTTYKGYKYKNIEVKEYPIEIINRLKTPKKIFEGCLV